MQEFFHLIAEAPLHVGFGIATGRRYEEVVRIMEELDIPQPEVLITAVGTEIYYGKNLTPDRSWQKHIDFRWEPERIREVLDGLDGFFRQPDHEQSAFKVSYQLDPAVAPKVEPDQADSARERLAGQGGPVARDVPRRHPDPRGQRGERAPHGLQVELSRWSTFSWPAIRATTRGCSR
jgi:hypothetical protein